MAKTATFIVVGANGSVYVAPVGTAEPASIATALNAAFVDLGYVSEDGAQIITDMTVEEIRAWQSLVPVRRITTEREFQLSFALLEWNRQTVPFFFGGGTVTGASPNYQFNPPDPSVIDERALALEWADGTKDYRIVVSRGMVIETDNPTLQRANAAALPVTFGAMPSTGTSQGWYLQTDDPSFA